MQKSNDEELRELSDKYIKDRFVYDGQEIVILEPSLYNGKVEKNALVLCKIVEVDEQNVLKSLSKEEYENAYEKYYELLEIFGGIDDD